MEQAPDIKLCLSTRGLALPQMVDEICKYNIDHVTITMNMVDPEVGAKIYPWIFWDHRRVTGSETATIPHRQRMLGLEMLSKRGVLTKINSVRIPGINDEHLYEVNREAKKRGAFLHNIMSLISEAEHGTVFGLTGHPTAQELKAVQDACMGGANVMRHCRQCRTDAVGLPGEDRSKEFTLDKIEQMKVVYDLDKRRAYQQQVEAVGQDLPEEVLHARRGGGGAGVNTVAMSRADEAVVDLVALMLDHGDPAAGTPQDIEAVAERTALRCLGDNHQWQDRHFNSRAELSALMHHWFAALVAKNSGDIKSSSTASGANAKRC